MPIDTSIYRNIEPPQMPDPMESYGRALSLKALLDRGQMNAIQLREAGLREQEREREMKDEEVIRKSYVDAEGNPDKFEALAKQNGASPSGLLKIRGIVLDQKTKLEALDEKARANAKAQGEIVAGYMTPIHKAKTDKRPALWTTARSQVIAAGHAKEADVPIDYPGDDLFEIQYAGVMGQKNYLDALDKAAQEQRAGEKHEAELPGARAKSDEEVRGNAAGQLAAASSADQYKRIWDGLPAAVARNFPAPEEWSAEKTSAAVRQKGMTPAQQSTGAETARHNRAMETRPGTPRTPEGLTVGEEKRRFDKAMEDQAGLQEQEQEQHRLRTRIGNAIKSVRAILKETPDNTEKTYIGPDGKPYPATKDQIQWLETGLAETAKKVKDLQGRQKKIREQFKVGEFSAPPGSQGTPISAISAGAPPPAIPAAIAPSTTVDAGPSKPAAVGAQRIRVKLADGRTGAIDAAQFDPKTMTKL